MRARSFPAAFRFGLLALALSLVPGQVAGALEGSVHDSSGAPLAGATVAAHAAESTAERQARWRSPRPDRSPLRGPAGPLVATTDASGRFTLDLPRDAFVLLEARAPGHEPAQRPVLGHDEAVSFTLARGREHRGRVTSGGRPVAGATVVWPRREDHDLVTTTGADGGFALVGSVHGMAGLLVLHPGFAPALPGREGPDPLHVELAPGRAVHGTVLHPNGAPAAGAELFVDGMRVGTAGARGELELANLPQGAQRLRATAGENLLAEAPLGEPGGGEEPLRLVLAPAAAVEGTVRLRTTEGVRPLAGLPLAVLPIGPEVASTAGPPRELLTDETGAYRSGPLPAGTYAVVVAGSAAQRLRTALSDVTLEGGIGPHAVALARGERTRHDLDLVLPAEVHGRLLDAAGSPVVGAAVALLPAQESPVHIGFDPELPRSGIGGRFVASLPWAEGPLQVRLVAARPGHSLAISEPFLLEPGVRLVRHLRVPPETEVEVRVTDPAGAPIRGARVAFVPLEASAMRVTPPARELLRNPVSTVAVDEGGRARLWLEAAEYELAAAAPGFQPRAVEAEVGGLAQVVTVALEPAVEVRGRVVRGGRPVAGVMVMLQTQERRDDPIVTGADGAFRFGELAPGVHTLMAMKHEEMVDERRRVTAPDADVVVELPPAGGLVVEVRDQATGAPVPGARLEVQGGPGRELGGRPLAHGGRGREGRFDFPSLPAGSLELVASAPGYLSTEPRRVEVREGTVAETALTLSRGATLRGSVTGEDGAPLAGARVLVAPQRGEAYRPRRVAPPMATTDGDGGYELSGLSVGGVSLVVAAEGFVPHHEQVEVTGDGRMDFRLSRGLLLAGRVVADGRPVPGARVGASTAALRGQEQSALSDAEGQFTLTGLVPALYTLSAFREGFGPRNLEGIDPRTGEPVVIDLSARSQGTLFGTVSGLPEVAAGGKVTRRVVSAIGNSQGAEAALDEAGGYRIEGAPTGAVKVRAVLETTTGMWSSPEVLVEVEPGEERRVDLELSSPLPVHGQVRLDGRPLAGARVVFALPDGTPVSTISGGDGLYAVDLPGPGTYRVGVHGEPDMAARHEAVHVIESPRTLDVDLHAREARGRVVEAGDGTAVPGAIVSLRATGTGSAIVRLSETMTGAGGEFLLPAATGGVAALVTAAPGFAPRALAVDLDDAGDLVVELERAEPLRVQVVEAGGDLPLQAHLEVRDEAGTALPVRAELLHDGTHELTLAPGRYRLTAVVGGHGQRTVLAHAPGTLRLEVEAGGELVVHSAVGGASVRVSDASGVEQAPCCEQPGWTLAGGGALLRGLAPGRYSVEVLDVEGRVLGSAPATVVAGGTSRVQID